MQNRDQQLRSENKTDVLIIAMRDYGATAYVRCTDVA
jgi:hypothetical protein